MCKKVCNRYIIKLNYLTGDKLLKIKKKMNFNLVHIKNRLFIRKKQPIVL